MRDRGPSGRNSTRRSFLSGVGAAASVPLAPVSGAGSAGAGARGAPAPDDDVGDAEPGTDERDATTDAEDAEPGDAIAWQRRVSDDGAERFETALALADGYVLAGEAEPDDERVGLVVRLDGDGRRQWRVHHDSVDRFTTLAPAPDGGFVAGGDAFSDDRFVAYDPDGTLRWVTETEYRPIDHVARLRDDTFAAVGRGSHEADSWVEYVRSDPAHGAFDAATHGHNDDVPQKPVAIRPAPDGGAHVLVDVESEPAVELWRVRSGGERAWTERFELDGEYDVGPRFVAARTDEGFLAVSERPRAGALLGFRIDATDRTADAVRVPVGGADRLSVADVASAPDGGAALVGTAGESREDADPAVLRIDESGSVAWRWRYDGGRYHSLRTAVFDPTDSLVLGGLTREPNRSEADAWVASVDELPTGSSPGWPTPTRTPEPGSGESPDTLADAVPWTLAAGGVLAAGGAVAAAFGYATRRRRRDDRE